MIHNTGKAVRRQKRFFIPLLLLIFLSLSTLGAGSMKPSFYVIPVPYNVDATVGLGSKITVTWSIQSSAIIDYFQIYYGGGTTEALTVDYVGGGDYSYDVIVNDMWAGDNTYANHTFSVKACNTSCGSSSDTAVGSAIIDAPFVGASSGTYTNRVEVYFEDYIPDSARTYEVYRSDSADGTYSYIGEYSSASWIGDPNVFVDNTVTQGQVYYYKGRTCAIYGVFSPPCSELSTTPAQGHSGAVPTGIQATDGTSDEIVVTWDAIPDAFFYWIYRSTSPTPPDPDVDPHYRETPYTTTTFTDVPAPYTTYYYWVRAYLATPGEYSPLSDSDSGWRIYRDSQNIQASDGTSMNGIDITWTNDDATDIDFYLLYRADTAEGTPYAIGTSMTLFFSDMSTAPDDVYYYYVQACDFSSHCSGLAGPNSGYRAFSDPPSISAISDQTIDEDTNTGALAFTVDDDVTAAEALLVWGTSSNQTLLPNANILLGGSGTDRTVTLTPAADQTGSATVTLTVDDGTQTTDMSFILTVDPIHDDPTGISLSSNSVAENQPSGTVVGTFTTTDPDSGETYSYSLVAGTGDSGNDQFTIVNDELQTAASFDYETQNSYSIRVQTDDGEGGVFEKIFTIDITNLNDLPPTISSIADQSINEDIDCGPLAFTVGDDFVLADALIVTGESSDQTLLPDANIVLGGSGADRTVTLSSAADQHGQVTVTITVDDGSQSSIESFVLTVNPVNDTPTDISLNSNTIAENQPAGTVVGILSTTDPDSGDTFTYSLVTGTGDSGNSQFTIVGDQLRTAASFDYETQSSYSIRVQTEDAVGANYEKIFAIVITDVDDTFIFEDDFETGDLSQWSRVNDGRGNLFACTEGAISGNWGACVERGLNDKRKQLIDQTPVDQTTFNVQFSFDINSLSMGLGERFRFIQVKMGDYRPFFMVVRNNGGQYYVRISTLLDDYTKATTGWYLLSDEPHTIEINWQAARTDGANDGYAELYLDDVLLESLANLDNDTIYVDTLKIGFTSRLDNKIISGSFYVDDVLTNNTSHIGLP